MFYNVPFQQPVVGSGGGDESWVNLIGVQQEAHSRRQKWAGCVYVWCEGVCVCVCVCVCMCVCVCVQVWRGE